MKAFLLSLSFLSITSIAVAGPSVSGGIVYEEKFENCSNKKEKTQLSIEAIMNPNTFVGLISEGPKNDHTLKCLEGKNQKSKFTGEEIVWICSEQRAGEGQLQVHINRNDAGLKYGVVYRNNIIGQLQEMYKLKCDQQVSNK